MNDKFDKLIRETVVAALAEKGSDVVADMANDILSKKVDPDYGDISGSSYGLLSLAYMRGSGAKQITYLEYLARQEVRSHIHAAVTGWFKSRSTKLKKQIIDRIDADTLADSYMSELAGIFDNGHFGVTLQVEHKDRDDD